jgi:membrane protease YdiL (CAAX protease family)
MAPEPYRRSLLARVFLTPSEPRLRSGWRLGLHGILSLGLASILTIVLAVPILLLGTRADDLNAILGLSFAITFISFTSATFLARRLLDRRSFRSLGFGIDRRTLPDLAAGILISGVMMGVIYSIEARLGWLHFQGWAWEEVPVGHVLAGVLSGLGLYLMVGFQEELFSRGYQLQNLAEGIGLPGGLILSSLIFASLHLTNPNSTWYATLLGLTAAGCFLASGWVRTRRLWLSIGLHLGWNFFEGTVFGFSVSGLNLFTLVHQTVHGPAWLTGGAFGPEAGLVILPGMAVGLGLVLLYTRGRLPID